MQSQDSAGASVHGADEVQDQQPFLLKIGVLRNTSRFVRSKHRLSFRHQRKEEDYARKPQWIDELDRGGGLHTKIGHKDFEAHIRAGRYTESS